MPSKKTVSDIVRFYKFKDFIESFSKSFSIENITPPVYNIDYTIDGDNLAVHAKTELGIKYLAFISKSNQEVDTEKK